jgi:hypothetical protein
MTEEHKCLLKHSGTSLRDLPVTVQIDRNTKTVELVSAGFDSVQIAGLVTHILPNYGVNAIRDESKYDDVKRPSWRLLYKLDEVRFICTVTIINDYSVSDGRDYNDPLKSYAKQTVVRLNSLAEDASEL